MHNAVRVAGILMVLTGFFFIFDGYSASAATGGTTTTTTVGVTTTQTTTTSVTTTVAGPGSTTYTVTQTTTKVVTVSGTSTITKTITLNNILITLSVGTVSSAGAQLQGTITVDGNNIGVGVASVQLTQGQHTVSCGSVIGYVTPTTQTVMLDGSTNAYSVNCVYAPVATQTFILSVKAQVYSIYGKTVFPLVGQNVLLSNGMNTQTNSSGVARFTVPAGPYTINLPDSGYGSYSNTVTVNGNTYVTAQFTTGAYSVVSGIFGGGATGIAAELITGIVLSIGGSFVFAVGGRKKGVL